MKKLNVIDLEKIEGGTVWQIIGGACSAVAVAAWFSWIPPVSIYTGACVIAGVVYGVTE